MNTDRLLRLADKMDRVKPANYNQGQWGEDITSRTAKFTKAVDDVGKAAWVITPKEGFCNSSACVLGHGVYEPGMGLALMASEYYTNIVGKRRVADEVSIVLLKDDGTIDPSLRGWDAAAVAFDIPLKDAEVMFGSGGHDTHSFYLGCKTKSDYSRFRLLSFDITPAQTATALREYVRTNGASMKASCKAADY